MTVLAAPSATNTTASPAEPTTSAANTDATAVVAVTPSRTPARLNHPAPTDRALTEQLLRQRERLPAGHPDLANLRAQVIKANLPMARHLARRYTGRGEPLDDLIQVAALALIKAVDGFDGSRQVPFAGYAVPSIIGALKRHFRDTAWAIRVPRGTQELTLKIATATADLSQQMGRTPTTADIARHLQVRVDDVVVAIGAARAYQPMSLNTSGGASDSADRAELIDLLSDPHSHYTRVDNHLELQPLFAALPQRERRILTMRFFGDMTQAQIAAEIGVTQMQVSRLLTRSIARLRAGMQQSPTRSR